MTVLAVNQQGNQQDIREIMPDYRQHFSFAGTNGIEALDLDILKSEKSHRIDAVYNADATDQAAAERYAHAEGKSDDKADFGRFGNKKGKKGDQNDSAKKVRDMQIMMAAMDSMTRTARQFVEDIPEYTSYLQNEAQKSQAYVDNYNANIGQIDGIVTEIDPQTGMQVISQAHIDQLTSDVQSVIEAELGEPLSSDPEERQAQIDATHDFLIDPQTGTFTQEAIDKYGADKLAELKELYDNTNAQQLENIAAGEQAYKQKIIEPELQNVETIQQQYENGTLDPNAEIEVSSIYTDWQESQSSTQDSQLTAQNTDRTATSASSTMDPVGDQTGILPPGGATLQECFECAVNNEPAPGQTQEPTPTPDNSQDYTNTTQQNTFNAAVP